MYNIQDKVFYGCHGACTITAIESIRFGKTKEKYYILEPVGQTDSKYYVPVNNPQAVAKMHPLMSAQALLELLGSEAVRANCWIDEESIRKQRYKELISGGDRTALLNMIHCLYEHKKAQLAAGKKFHQCDENFLHDAQRLLNSEFSLVFGLEQSEVNDFIQQHLCQPG